MAPTAHVYKKKEEKNRYGTEKLRGKNNNNKRLSSLYTAALRTEWIVENSFSCKWNKTIKHKFEKKKKKKEKGTTRLKYQNLNELSWFIALLLQRRKGKEKLIDYSTIQVFILDELDLRNQRSQCASSRLDIILLYIQ